MSINVGGVGPVQFDYAYVQKPKVGGVDVNPAEYTDTYTSSSKESSSLYTKDAATIKKLWDEAEAATSSLRGLVSSLFGADNAGGQGFWALRADADAEITPEARAEAEAMIGEDGYFGVKQTTDRIMDFAKALAGGKSDSATIENLREGAQKGFDDVAEMFGGFDKLPEVTRQTYEAVMQAFDDWQATVTE